MSSNSGMDLLTLMGIISQMESKSHMIPETKLNDPKHVVNTRERIYEHGNGNGNGNTRVNKNIGTTHRRYNNLMGNAKTNKRI